MQICPEYLTVNVARCLEHVVMVAPVDAEKNEAQYVGKEDRQQRTERGKAWFMPDLQLQHHDRDQDGDHAVTKCLEPGFVHLFPSSIFGMPVGDSF